MTLKGISVFAGVGGFDLGFEKAGIECVAQIEIDDAARGVLNRHFSHMKKWKDICDVSGKDLPTADVVYGGFPCQDLSVAGKRAGLDGERSGFWFEFHRLIAEVKPRFVVIENVPGLLSSGPTVEDPEKPAETIRRKGIDFAIILAGLTGVVPTIPDGGWRSGGFMRGRRGFYNLAWRVLDSQYYGVPQRRRRVFIVASLGDASCVQILFEPESGAWYLAPGEKTGARSSANAGEGADPVGGGRELGAEVPATLRARGKNTGTRLDNETGLVAPSKTARQAKGAFTDPANDGLIVDDPEERLRQGGAVAFDWQAGNGGKDDSFRGKSRSWIVKQGDYSGSLNAVKVQAVAIRTAQTGENGHGISDEAAHTLDGASGQSVAFQQNQRGEVRKIGGDGDQAGALQANPGMKQQNYVYTEEAGVRHYAPHSHYKYEEDDTSATLQGRPNRQRGDTGLVLESRYVRNGRGAPDTVAPPLKAQSGSTGKGDGAPLVGVRRFTPRECERLQGFPDDWSLHATTDEGEETEQADSPRYRQMGNAVTVNVAHWIAERIVRMANID